jgi:hypothetical protein
VAKIFIIFLIALLPLRGWSSDRMSLQMEHGVNTVSIASDFATSMSPDCPMAMQMGTQPHGGDTGQGAVQKGCQSCQLCMPLAGLHAPVILANIPNIQTAPELRAHVFVSAETVRYTKPPIS